MTCAKKRKPINGTLEIRVEGSEDNLHFVNIQYEVNRKFTEMDEDGVVFNLESVDGLIEQHLFLPWWIIEKYESEYRKQLETEKKESE